MGGEITQTFNDSEVFLLSPEDAGGHSAAECDILTLKQDSARTKGKRLASQQSSSSHSPSSLLPGTSRYVRLEFPIPFHNH